MKRIKHKYNTRMTSIRHSLLRLTLAAALLGGSLASALPASAAEGAPVAVRMSPDRESPAAIIRVEGSTLSITPAGEEAVNVSVYALTGQIVKQLELSPGETASVELNKGIYIVKAGKHSQRVIVR